MTRNRLPKVFISHSSADSWIARHIAKDLAALNIETFLDAKDIETGESIDDSIRYHLEQSDELLVLVSPLALKSQWVFMEVGGAHVLGKRLIPILVHVTVSELPLPIARHLARNINDIERYYQELERRSVHKAAPGSAEEVVVEPSEPQRQTNELKVGDRVRITDSPPDDLEEPPGWDERMSQFLGLEATTIRGAPNNCFFLDVDRAAWLWSPNWLHLVWSSG